MYFNVISQQMLLHVRLVGTVPSDDVSEDQVPHL